MDATDSPVTDIDSAIASLIQPEETAEVEQVEEVEEESEDTPEMESDDESEEPEEDDSEEVEVEDDEDAEEAEYSEPEAYTVKVDGKEQQVSLEELKRGYSGQQYVQKGMQEAATLRKQAEEVYTALLNERQQISQLFQQVQQGGMPQPPKEPSREMFESDPIGYMEAKLNYDEQKASYEQQMGQFRQVVEKQSQAQQIATRAYLEREMEALKAAMPEFADPDKSAAVREKLVSKGTQVYGYTPEEISQVMDHRAIRVLNDAIKYQELMSGKKKAVENAKPKTRKVLKAGSKKTASNNSVERQTRSKLKRTGRIEDALGLLIQN